jgi:carbon-monoxide dehydrogenase small subunit
LKKAISLNVNGDTYELLLNPNQTLLDVLREELGLTGTKKGCDSGACGACTVLIDGEPVLSCMTLAVRCQEKQITTVEGLSQNGQLHPLQKSAIEHDAVQCGFCTPGWMLSAKVLLDNNPTPTRKEIRTAISGNLCRCTGYQKIEESIIAAANEKAKQASPPTVTARQRAGLAEKGLSRRGRTDRR